LDVDFTKAGSYEYLSSLSGAALAEMKGVLVVT
jgi:plastocyanin